MSGWRNRLILAAAAASTFATTAACARAERAPAAAAFVTSGEEEALFAAYSNWRRAVTCATSWAPGPIGGAADAEAIGDSALRRLREAGQGALIARLAARHEEIDSRIDWACADPPGATPAEVAAQRLKGLEAAGMHLAAVVDAAIR